MNSALLTLGAVAALILGYFIYGRFIERRCVNPDEDRPTPAFALRDGMDYEPARPLMLFGHHFTTIAGAGPIVGPAIAVAYFGWGTTLGWIILGSIFIGGVHDYLALMVSARNQGKSISEIAGRLTSKRASIMLGIFLWLALVLIIAIFALLAAQTLIEAPSVVIPNVGLLAVAALLGLGVYRWKQPLWLVTIFGIAAMVTLLWLGDLRPLSLPRAWGDPKVIWFFFLMAYCLLATVLPVWFLLQPRDYLSSTITYAGIIVGIVAIFAAHAPVNAPAHVAFVSDKGPLWPMLFIIVACGAISGFHSLVSSGTTVKQLANERQGLPIAYGSMILEAIQAVSVTFLIAAGLYWAGSHLGPDGKSLVIGEIMGAKGGGAVSVFIRSFANLTSQGIPFISFSTALLIAAIALNATLLDTLDTATRLARFILSELLGDRIPLSRNRWVTTLITLAPAAYLGLSGTGTVLWPVFGAANQLIAALAFLVIAVYLAGLAKPNVYVIVPGLFVLITTIAALLYQAWGFLLGKTPNLVLGIICLLLVALAVYVSLEAFPRLRQARSRSERIA